MRIVRYYGERVRRAVAIAAALAIAILVVMTASAGWGWAVAAWFGTSAVTFTVCTALAGRAAQVGELTEREFLGDRHTQRSSGVERHPRVRDDIGRR
jgi:fatty acid desaturase